MIDTNQLSALVSAFRVETVKESISPEAVGKILLDILDLLKTASSDTERKVLDDWKNLLSQYTVVYDVAHATGMADMEHMFLTLKGRSLRNGASFTSSVPLYGATDLKAGIMTAAHVQAIMALQSSLPQVRSAVTALQTTVQQHGWQLSAIQAAAFVVTDIKQSVGNATKIFLSLTKHDVRTGEDFPGLGSVSIAAATANQAGAMTAAHVTSLANAKTDITALQSAMRKVQGAGCVVNVFMMRRHAIDDMEARQRCIDEMRELFRQFMSALFRERTRLEQGILYFDNRVQFTEIEQYFAAGCACAYFQIAYDVYTNLVYRPEEWQN